MTVENKEQLAELTIYKEGQVLTGADFSENGTVFQYENRRQKNAVYNVYAGADIVTAYGTKVYSKGDLVKDLSLIHIWKAQKSFIPFQLRVVRFSI